jgi:biofilm PGA synthesis N-glycosyltransferase PgaC
MMITGFIIGWNRIKNDTNDVNIKVSVIISIRNEGHNIKKLVESLRNQNYNKDFYDVIIVNDHSDDNSWELLCNEKLNWPHLQLLDMDVNEYGKKKALSKAINFSNSEVILTSDADCIFSPEWIKSMTSCFINDKINLASGPVSFNHQSTFFNQIQTLEFLSLIASGAAAIGLNQPIFCNGANLAYRRKVFLEVNNYDDNDIASGDDVFLLHLVKKLGPGSILFIKKFEAIVLTDSIATFRQFINQRIRWVSKSSSYKDAYTIYTSILVFFVNSLLISLLFLSFYDNAFINIFTFFILIKFVFDLLFFKSILVFFKRLDLIKWVFPLQIIYSFYITFITLLSSFMSFNWKGRIQNK